MTAREVVDFFAPGTQAVGEVKQWLKASGVEERRLGLSGNKQVSLHRSSDWEVEGINVLTGAK